MDKPFVFISYSTKDSDIADQVYKRLKESGINCWYAYYEIKGGDDYADEIVVAIRNCSAFVVIASPNSNSSPHVSSEISLAFGNKKKIIPFRIQSYELSNANEYFFQHSQWITANGNINDALNQLIKAVKTVLLADNGNNTISSTSEASTYATNRNADLCNLLEKIDQYANNFKASPDKTAFNDLSIAVDNFDAEFNKIPLSKRGAISQDWTFLKTQRENIRLCMGNTQFTIMLADQISGFVSKIYSALY